MRTTIRTTVRLVSPACQLLTDRTSDRHASTRQQKPALFAETQVFMKTTISSLNAAFLATLLFAFGSLSAELNAQSYLNRLRPALELRFDVQPAKRVELSGGVVLARSERAKGQGIPALIEGPHPWTGKAWDFNGCDVPFLFTVTKEQADVVNTETADGFAVSMWIKATYKGEIGYMLGGPFVAHSGRGGTCIEMGSSDYKTVATNAKHHSPFDGRWHHVVVAVDFREAKDNMRLYYDGALVKTSTKLYIKERNIASDPGRKWVIGARTDGGSRPFSFGALANVAIFERPLDEEDVRSIFEGPVYAGSDQQVVMPNVLRLKGLVPTQEASTWRIVSGPAEVDISDPAEAETEVAFSRPGEYVFEIKAESGAGAIRMAPRHIMLAKYLWPEDRMIDYVWGRLVKTDLPESGDRYFEFFDAVFSEPVRYPEQSVEDAAAGLNPVAFCPDQGFMNARDRWSYDGIRLNFRCRMDKYATSHVHADCNAFELWAKNRMCNESWASHSPFLMTVPVSQMSTTNWYCYKGERQRCGLRHDTDAFKADRQVAESCPTSFSFPFVDDVNS